MTAYIMIVGTHEGVELPPIRLSVALTDVASWVTHFRALGFGCWREEPK